MKYICNNVLSGIVLSNAN